MAYLGDKYSAKDFAYTMASGGAGGEGSTAVPWIKTGLGGASLPENIRKLIYGGTGPTGSFDPFATATGYAKVHAKEQNEIITTAFSI